MFLFCVFGDLCISCMCDNFEYFMLLSSALYCLMVVGFLGIPLYISDHFSLSAFDCNMPGLDPSVYALLAAF